jgi:DNA polymerase I-like protein with 3'-5' exonuclease and polymerase domains
MILKRVKDRSQSFKGGPYSQQQLQYLADDLITPWLVFPKLIAQLQNEELDWVNALELSALPALQEMELTGFAIDDESRVTLQESLEQQLEKLTTQLPQLEKPAKGKKLATVEPLNINSHSQIREYFQKTWRINLPDTKEETLIELAKTTGKPEAASLLNNITECRHLHKRLNTYVNHLQDKHRRSDGRVHGQFNPLGTVSGVMVGCMGSSIHWAQSVVESLPVIPTSRTFLDQQSSANSTSHWMTKSL